MRLDDADQLRVHAQRAGLQPAHVEQVLHQPDQLVQRLLGGGQQFGAVGVAERDVVAAQAGHRRLGRRERGAQVVADRGEQGAAQPVGLAESGWPPPPARPAVPVAARPRPGPRRPRPPAGRRRRGSVHTGRATARRRSARRRRPRPGAHGTVADDWPRPARRRGRAARSASPPLSGRRSSRVTLVSPNVSRTCSSSAFSGRPPRRTLPATVDSVSASARALRGLDGTPGGEVDHGAHGHRDEQEDQQRQQVLAVGDGELVDRWGEEVVQQRRTRPRPRPAPGRGRRPARPRRPGRGRAGCRC